ncbi:enoyl-CoA hydratase/isomerase family protein [Pseudonocardia alni]|uniref:enoyl-CoA hydratase/isomerase family protein n=1 Tax=Pseudonocardia alni TaxID=33907 RepID=UPI00280C37F0|nr:enoyl-CoA hydratase/isomerase family protein [Pseudonocardia alni]
MEMTYDDVVTAAHSDRRQFVEVEHHGDHAIVRLTDPERRNALSAPMMVQLLDAVSTLTRERGIRVVVLTGDDGAFSAGGDLQMMTEQTRRQFSPEDTEGAYLPMQWIRHQFGAMARLIARSDTTFIAALDGPAAGVGLAFALTCDLAIAADTAILVPAFGRLGLVPEVGTSWALTRAMGYRRAFEFYVGGRHLDASEALRLGLVNEVVGRDQLRDTVLQWTRRIADLPPHAVPIAKPLLRSAADTSWEQTLMMEELAEPICFTTAGFRRGVADVASAVHRRSTGQ